MNEFEQHLLQLLQIQAAQTHKLIETLEKLITALEDGE